MGSFVSLQVFDCSVLFLLSVAEIVKKLLQRRCKNKFIYNAFSETKISAGVEKRAVVRLITYMNVSFRSI